MSVIKQEIEIETGYYDETKFDAVAFRPPLEGETFIGQDGHKIKATNNWKSPRLILRRREQEPDASYYGKMVEVRASVASPWVREKLLFVLPPGFDYRFLCECAAAPEGTKQWAFARVIPKEGE